MRGHFVMIDDGRTECCTALFVAKCPSELNTYSELPLDRLHQFLVSQVRILPARLDLLWQLVLIPEGQERR